MIPEWVPGHDEAVEFDLQAFSFNRERGGEAPGRGYSEPVVSFLPETVFSPTAASICCFLGRRSTGRFRAGAGFHRYCVNRGLLGSGGTEHPKGVKKIFSFPDGHELVAVRK